MATIKIQGETERLNGIFYEVDTDEAPLGEGGMGTVYKGWRCSETDNKRREVAIKFLYSDLPPHVIARARREASVQLRNDNLVEMIGFVEVKDRNDSGDSIARFHVVSEYLHGVTLDRLMEGSVLDHRGKVIPYAQQMYNKYLDNPYSFAMDITKGVLSGLMALHDSGYIHRDIDPSNIMITSDGKVKLIDFGIAKKYNSSTTKDNSYTMAGQFMGKPKYAAPELVRGILDSQNPSTDLYAVGILLFQLVTGHVPFDGEMLDVLDMQVNKPLPLADVKQKQLRNVIKTATQKRSENRFHSASEFRVALEKLSSLPYPEKGFSLSGPMAKKILIGIAGVAVIAGIIIGIAAIDSGSDEGGKSVGAPGDSDSEATAVAAQERERYADAVALLAEKATATRGLEKLRELSGNGDYQATFLLSRLYFSSPESVYVGAFSDSVAKFRKNLDIKPDNAEAHRLLGKAVAINGSDYRSLFELGCDFKSKRRGGTFNTDSAYIYLNKARQLADKAGDRIYSSAIAGRMSNLRPAK